MDILSRWMETGSKPMSCQDFPYFQKYCILIGLELYPFTSKVYLFAAFTGIYWKEVWPMVVDTLLWQACVNGAKMYWDIFLQRDTAAKESSEEKWMSVSCWVVTNPIQPVLKISETKYSSTLLGIKVCNNIKRSHGCDIWGQSSKVIWLQFISLWWLLVFTKVL